MHTVHRVVRSMNQLIQGKRQKHM